LEKLLSTGPATIFQLNDARSWRGGEQQVLYLHEGLLELDRDSRVICQRDSALHQVLAERKLPHYALRMMGGHDPGAALKMARLMANENTLLHAHTSHAHDLGLWAKRLGARSRLVISRRVAFAPSGGWLGRRKYLNRRVDLYLAISSAVQQVLLESGVSPDRIRLVPSGVELSRFADVQADLHWRAGFSLAPGELLFCNVAALTEEKCQSTLIAAFRLFLDSGGSGKLVILGEGELRAQLQEQCTALALADSVFLPGFSKDVLPGLRAADVMVLSSRSEGLGTSILDAMALGRPVIASRAGGIVDVVDDGETGILVPPEDPAALAQAMADLQQSASSRQRMGLAGTRKVQDFDVRKTVQLTLDAYDELYGGQ